MHLKTKTPEQKNDKFRANFQAKFVNFLNISIHIFKTFRINTV